MDLAARSRALFAAMGQGSTALAPFFAARCRYDVPGLAGFHGRGGATAFLAAMRRNLPDLRFRVRSVVVEGHRTVVRWQAHASGPVHPVTGSGVHILEWNQEGEVARAEVYSDPDLLRESTRVQSPPPAARTPRKTASFLGRLRHRRQATDYTCGPAALAMVLGAFGQRAREASLAAQLGTEPRVGTRQRAIERLLVARGLRVRVRHTTATTLAIQRDLRRGAAVMVCYWLEEEATDHYAVVTRIGQGTITLADPWHGPERVLPLEAFESLWRGDPTVHTRRDRWMLAVSQPAPRGGVPPVNA